MPALTATRLSGDCNINNAILVQFEEAQNATNKYQPILLSSAVASAARDSHRKRASSADSGSSTATRNCWKNLDGTILVPVDPVVDFKNCCLHTGDYDGERRNYFFQGLGKGADRFRPAINNKLRAAPALLAASSAGPPRHCAAVHA